MASKVKGSLFAFLNPFVTALFVLLFIYTGFNKLFGLNNFTDTLMNQPIPHFFIPFLAWGFPSLEILAAACLLFPRTRRLGLLSALTLMVIFTGYIAAILLHFFRRVPCSCGGIFRTLSWQQHLWVNLGLIVLALLALIRKPVSSSLNLSL